MAYIIFVNPSILASTGMDQAAVATAAILSAGITTILMGLFVNYPFALASGMGLNAPSLRMWLQRQQVGK